MRNIYRDGELIEVPDDYTLKDGERLNVSTMFMDGALVDANLNDAHRTYVDRLTRKDGDGSEDADDIEDQQAHGLTWHIVNPMFKDHQRPAPSHVVRNSDIGDAHAAYVARLTGRTMQDKAPDVARLNRRSVQTADKSPDDAHAEYVRRLTRR